MNGIITVAQQEFRTRIRTGRWKVLLAAWVIVIGLFTVLVRLALSLDSPTDLVGIPMFGWLMMFVLGLSLLIAPAITAQSINGDRERGTLATLQVTRLTPAQIGLGKLLASWFTLLAFLGLTLPFVAWAVAEGGVGIPRALAVLGVVILLTGVILATAQALSALVVRGITSTMLAYLTVFTLLAGTAIAFALAMPMTTEEVTEHDYTYSRPHPEKVWWLLAPNPMVVLADSAPLPPLEKDDEGRLERVTNYDPLSSLGEAVRQTRIPSDATYAVYTDDIDEENERTLTREQLMARYPVWPTGLGMNLLLGGGSVWLTVRRLRAPQRTLPKGVRVA